MNWAAIGLYLLFLVVAFGARTVIQQRRTGDTGLRLGMGRVGSALWWAKLSFLGAIGLCGAAPVAGIAGVKPLPLLDFQVLRWTGAALALLGIAGTAAAQLAMGDSWRIGVDLQERTTLVTGGPFGLVRNPIFTAFLAACGGINLMIGNIVAVLGFVAVLASIEFQVRAVEEPYLRRIHQQRYDDYAARVGRFVPGVGRLGHSAGSRI